MVRRLGFLEVLLVEKHAQMAEREHGGRRRGLERPWVFWEFGGGRNHLVLYMPVTAHLESQPRG